VEPIALDSQIADILWSFPEISSAWVFGSEARGQARADSDLDIAILTDARAPRVLEQYEWLGRVAAHLERAAPGRRIDLVPLEAQGPVFQHRVLSEGRLVFERNAKRRIDFESDVYVRYFDYYPVYERASRLALASFASGWSKQP
jgi:uncharacterized protein